MKKIMAAAVAAAFVSPAALAEITVGGELEYVYVMESTATDKMTDNDNLIFVSSTTELPNGMTVSGKFQLVNDTSSSDDALDDQGSSITLSGDFGSLSVGDVSGASDATGDWTDIGPTGGGFGADGDDHVIAIALPAMNGFTLRASYAPDGSNDVNSEDNDTTIIGGNSVSLTYSGAADFYIATQEDATTNYVDTAYGIRATVGGVYMAYERATEEGSGNDNEVSGVAVSYKMGDLEFGAEKQEEKISGAAATTDLTMLYAQYHLGPVDIYVSSLGTDVTSDNDETRVGIEYNF